MGLTFGLVGLGSAIWMRRRLSDRLEHLSELDRDQIPSVRERVAKRAHLTLAATTVTGTAVVTSGNLDALERALFGPGGHREIGHSLISGLLLNRGGNWVVDRFRVLAERLCETLGMRESDMVRKTIRATTDLVKLISNGAFVGQLTHVLGDLPTSGTAGVSALRALTPIIKRDISLGLIKSSSRFWNALLWKAGLAIGAGSLVTMLIYTVAPKWPSETVKDTVKKTWELKPELTFEKVSPLVHSLLEQPARVI